MRKLISGGSPYEPKVGISRAVRVDNAIAVSGTAPLDSEGCTVGIGDAAAQARRCLEIIAGALEKAGSSLRQVIRTRTFVVRIEDWEAVAAVHREFFGEIRPANTIIQVSRFIDPDWLVELEADAVGQDQGIGDFLLGTYKIVSQSSGKALAIRTDRTTQLGLADHAPLEQETYVDNSNQQWILVPLGGFYKIRCALSNEVLDVPGFATGNGVIIQQYPENGGLNQQWLLVNVGNEFYKIVSRSSAKVLDVPGFVTGDGAMIQQYTDNGGINQHWHLSLLEADPLLNSATISFHTLDENLDYDSRLSVWVYGPAGNMVANFYSDSDAGFPREGFSAGSDHSFDLTVGNIQRTELLAKGSKCTIQVNPIGHDIWRFDFVADMIFTDGSHLYSGGRGVQLGRTYGYEHTEQSFPITGNSPP